MHTPCCDRRKQVRTCARALRPQAILLFLLLAIASADAQNVSPYTGTKFLIAVPDTVRNARGDAATGPTTRVDIVIFSTREANVTLEGFGVVRHRSIIPNASQLVPYEDLFRPGSPMFVDVPGVPVKNRSIEITSDAPIYIYCRIVTPFGSELFAPFPVEHWGNEYSLASLRNDPLLLNVGINAEGEEGLEQGDGPGQLLVIASEDNTKLTLRGMPSTSTNDPIATLNAGEALLLETKRPKNNLDVDPRDLMGATIRATNPIAVISGNTRSAGGVGAYHVKAPTTNSARNLLLEWLSPVELQGQTFVYVPILTDFDQTEELIRITGTGQDATTMTTSFGGPAITILQNRFAELKSSEWRMNGEASPFVIRTDKPAQAVVVTGSWSEEILDPAGDGYGGFRAWGPSMSLLPPVKDWINVGRVPYFDSPEAVDQSVVLVAERDASLTLDGKPLVMIPVANSGFKWGRAPIVGTGDHVIESLGGKFSGIVYGIRSGTEAFRPTGTRKKDDGPHPLHVAVYQEELSLAWSTPLLGIALPDDVAPDKLNITTRDYCDSTVITVDRVNPGDIWTLGPLTAFLDPGSVNVDPAFIADDPLGPVLGYHIVLAPIDPEQDAYGSITIRGRGVTESVSFTYAATMVTLPDEIDFGIDLPAGVDATRSVDMTNRKSFTGTVLWAELTVDDGGFVLDDGDRLPRPLASGQTVTVDVLFSGDDPGITYRDTLLVGTDCGIYGIPLHARTSGAPPPRAQPTITGYDWGVRPVLSANDTISFAGNEGGRPYRIRDVVIANDPDGAFSLAAPRFQDGAVEAEVGPGDVRELGIRFSPPAPGLFLASIRLITEGADSIYAELRGIGRDTVSGGFGRVEIDGLRMDSVCLGDRIDTFLVIRNIGTAPAGVTFLDLIRSTNGTLLFPDAAALPRSLPVNDTLHVPVRIVPAAPGPFEFLVGVDTGAGTEGVVVRIDGIAVECEPPALTVTDHDFGTIWITTVRDGTVMLHNVGRGDVTVTDATVVNDAGNSFAYLGPIPPFTVPEGDSVMVTASFSPAAVGVKTAEILFETEIGERRPQLTGTGKRLVIPALIRRNYHGMPGDEVVVDVELAEPADSVFPERLDLDVGFADELLSTLGVVPVPGIGVPAVDPGRLRVSLSRSAQSPLTGGTKFRLRFLTRLSLVESTELPFELSCGLPYVEFVESPGLFTKDPFCMLEQRLFEFTRFGLLLEGPTPNPASDRTGLVLEIPFDSPTRIVVYDLLGAERLLVLDDLLPAGRYTYTIPLDGLENGTYVIRVNGGSFAFTRRLDVER